VLSSNVGYPRLIYPQENYNIVISSLFLDEMGGECVPGLSNQTFTSFLCNSNCCRPWSLYFGCVKS